MPIPWIKVAGTIYQVGKVLLTGKELTEHVNAILKDRKRGLDGQEQISSRVQQLEEALARQAELHRQHQIQMELMHTALQDLQQSLRWALALAGLSLMFGLAAIFWAAFR